MIKYMEICKNNGKSKGKNIKNKMYNIWDMKRIKDTFNFGNGNIEDFKRYMQDNKQLAYFEKL